MGAYEEFHDLHDKRVALLEAEPRIYSTDMNERAAARATLENLMEETGAVRLQPGDYENAPIVKQAYETVQQAVSSRVTDKFRDNLDEILQHAKDDKLSKLVLALTSPEKNPENKTRKKAADAHTRYQQYSQLYEEIKNKEGEEYQSKIGDVVKYIEKDMEKRVSDIKGKTRDKIVKSFKNIIRYLIANNPAYGKQKLLEMRKAAQDEFEAVYKTDEERAEYARQNIRVQARDDRKVLEAADKYSLIDPRE